MLPILLFYYGEIINFESLNIFTQQMSQRLNSPIQNTPFPHPKTQIQVEPTQFQTLVAMKDQKARMRSVSTSVCIDSLKICRPLLAHQTSKLTCSLSGSFQLMRPLQAPLLPVDMMESGVRQSNSWSVRPALSAALRAATAPGVSLRSAASRSCGELHVPSRLSPTTPVPRPLWKKFDKCV